MHVVCLTAPFIAQAADAGMSDREVDELVEYLARNPKAGDEMPGTGGCRKLRWAGRGKGKSGGFRAVTFYTGEILPVFLLAALSKGDRGNFTKAERNALASAAAAIEEGYGKRTMAIRRNKEKRT